MCLERDRKRRQVENKMTARPVIMNNFEIHTKMNTEIFGHEF